MTQKQMLALFSLWFFTIGIFGLGFSWLVSSGDCDLRVQEIARVTDNQDDLLLSYSLLFALQDKKPEKLKAIINQREGLIKLKIENFQEACRSHRFKKQLVSILRFYEIYLLTKQVTLKEKQDHEWHQSLFPVEFAFKDK